MGIEPTRAPLPELENKWFRAMTNPKCDGRVNFRVSRTIEGNVGIDRRAKPGLKHTRRRSLSGQ